MPDFLGPDFLGIGAQKGGTTWLYFALAHHPQIFMPDCKEVHFWDAHYTRGYGWYEGLFDIPTGSEKEARLASRAALVPQGGLGSSSRQVGREGSEIKRGEITPAYGILPAETIAEIRERYPHLRLIYMMRDQAARAWSGAMMGLGRAEMHVEEASDQWFLDHFRSGGSLARGDYAACLKGWLAHFPKEQFLLLHYDGIKNDPRGMLKAVAAHLGVDGNFFDTLDESHLTRRRNEGSGHKLRPSLVPALEEIYAPKKRELEKLLQETGLKVIGG